MNQSYRAPTAREGSDVEKAITYKAATIGSVIFLLAFTLTAADYTTEIEPLLAKRQGALHPG